jgi:1,4-dihydroxy-2-naphthoyl-CoA hydrolase
MDSQQLTLEELNHLGRGALAERMDITFVEASAHYLVATMPVEGNTQPMGLLHGGASVVLAETIGSVGSWLHARTLGMVAVGIDINATHHRSATSGRVTGIGRAISLGRTLATYEIEISDDTGERICTSRITCLLRPSPSS